MDDVSPRTVGVDLRTNQINPLTQLLAAGGRYPVNILSKSEGVHKGVHKGGPYEGMRGSTFCQHPTLNQIKRVTGHLKKDFERQ